METVEINGFYLTGRAYDKGYFYTQLVNCQLPIINQTKSYSDDMNLIEQRIKMISTPD